MKQYAFSVFYDGESLGDHVMDAKSVAKSISSFVDLFDEINKTLHTEGARPNIRLQLIGAHSKQPEAFEAGSFGWNFRFISDSAGRAVDLIKSVVVDGEKTYGLPAAIFAELSQLIKRINGREIEIHRERTGKYTLKIDNEIIHIEQHQALLLANEKIQEAMKKIVSPLHNPGISTFGISTSIQHKHDALVTITEGDEAMSFKGNKAALIPRTETSERNVACYIETLSYNPKNPWKLVSEHVNDNKPFAVTIIDASFLNSVAENNKSFAKSDILVVRLHEKRVYNPVSGTVKTTYIVQEVLDHKRPAAQANLL